MGIKKDDSFIITNYNKSLEMIRYYMGTLSWSAQKKLFPISVIN